MVIRHTNVCRYCQRNHHELTPAEQGRKNVCRRCLRQWQNAYSYARRHHLPRPRLGDLQQQPVTRCCVCCGLTHIELDHRHWHSTTLCQFCHERYLRLHALAVEEGAELWLDQVTRYADVRRHGTMMNRNERGNVVPKTPHSR